MELLKKFYHDIHTRDAVKEHITDFITEEAVDAVFKGKDTSAFKKAKDLLDAAFQDLEQQYGEKTKSSPRVLE